VARQRPAADTSGAAKRWRSDTEHVWPILDAVFREYGLPPCNKRVRDQPSFGSHGKRPLVSGGPVAAGEAEGLVKGLEEAGAIGLGEGAAAALAEGISGAEVGHDTNSG
jgi:hypothetical protein